MEFVFFIKILSIFLLSCDDNKGESFVYGSPDSTPPTVSSTSPSDLDNYALTGGSIAVKFSEAMNPTTMTTNTSGPVDTSCWGTIQVSSDNFTSCAKMSTSVVASNTEMRGSKTFSVYPPDYLSTSTQYKIRVTTGVRDSSGNSMNSQFETSNGFTTLSYHSKGCRSQNKIFVAVGNQGTILTSSDGISWTLRRQVSGSSLNQVFCANGIIVAVGESGEILTSSDGISWTSRASNTSGEELYQVTHGNDTFVVVGILGIIRSSSNNGSSWDNGTSSTSSHLNAVTYANGTFVAVGTSGTIRTSTDGNSWDNRTSSTSNNLNAVTYANGTFVAVGTNGVIRTSSDNGSSWDNRTSGHSNELKKIIFANNTFVAVGDNSNRTTSIDNGTTWTSRSSSSYVLNDIAYGNGSFVAIGQSWSIYRSENGTSWSTYINRDTSDYYTLQSITYGNNIFVIVGLRGVIHTSVDGYKWIARRDYGYENLNDVIYLK